MPALFCQLLNNWSDVMNHRIRVRRAVLPLIGNPSSYLYLCGPNLETRNWIEDAARPRMGIGIDRVCQGTHIGVRANRNSTAATWPPHCS